MHRLNIRLGLAVLFALGSSACLAATEPGGPPAAASADVTGTLLIGNKGEDTVSFIDLATGQEVARRDTGRMPHEIALSPDGRTAAVVAYGGQTIDLFDVASGRTLATIDLAPNLRPHGITWRKDGRILATTEGSDTLTILTPDGSGGWGVASVPTGNKGSHMLAVTPDGGRAFVSNLQSKNVTAIDLARGVKIRDLDAGTEPEGITLTPDGRELWVAARGSNEVFVFDAMTLDRLANIETGQFPIRIAISPDGKYAVTSNLTDGALSVIDTVRKQVVRTIPVSGGAEAYQVTILFSGDGRRIYVAETGTNTIAEVDFAKGEVIRRLPAGEDGDGLGITQVAFGGE